MAVDYTQFDKQAIYGDRVVTISELHTLEQTPDFDESKLLYPAPPTPGTGGTSLYNWYYGIRNKLEKLSSIPITFNDSPSGDLQTSPFQKTPCELNEFTMAGWALFEISNNDWSSVDAISDNLLTTDRLTTIHSSEGVYDSYSRSKAFSEAIQGDLLFFDTYQQNSLPAVYIGDGKALGMFMLDTNNHLISNVVNVKDTDWINSFSGNIRRLPSLDDEDYIWQDNFDKERTI